MVAEEKRYIDVNIFVYWLTDDPKFGEIAHQWIKNIEGSPRGEYVTSSLCIYETLVIVAGLTGKNLKDKVFIEEAIKAITGIKGLIIEPLNLEDFVRAVDIMNDYKLDYEDSIHLAVAIRTGAQEIISNDKDFKTVPIKRIF
ncbi:MAG: type II toxin-antitoxin system VapC family toxin [Candidatus Bathyarchaeia archaeon]|jgi:predicted nucleic acid-binding protein